MDKDGKIIPGSVDLIDANFVHLYRSTRKNGLALVRDDSKEIKKDEVSDIHTKINALYAE